ncbi:MAG: 3-methyl-2-oxobutanoate hydroxymethyltransferase [Nitrospinae bacterium]|nr:3-methyl-2-oxobutanoate hydroxymethyltransferase [Nitrospinota bacterium]
MEKITALKLSEFKRQGRKITALTAYDAPFARLMERAGVDVILVGDSVGMAVHGRPDTLSVTMEEMVIHARAVAGAVKTPLVVVDMPFMSFQVSKEKAVENAGRLIKETGAQAVKLEGGDKYSATIRAIVDAGIPVMGHVGLTPQSVHQLGGYKVQGKQSESARKVLSDAHAVEKAGAFSVVIEAVPADLGAAVTQSLKIPTIGIGAGPDCDGQILVLHDLLGLSDGPHPRFVKMYANFAEQAVEAFKSYRDEVQSGAFPAQENTYGARGEGALRVVGKKKE